ncbi:MAG: ABC transporter permease [Anaerolineaceae bacterium]|nr:ABC transporter permease [Anaerolineaceae bacterium]
MELINTITDLLFGSDPELRQIIAVTLRMSLFSTLFSSLIGIPAGILLGANNFRGKRVLTRLVNTLLGLPPVVAGLIVFLLLSRSGSLGNLKLLYTVNAMVVAQVLLITSYITAMTANLVGVSAATINETLAGVGIRGTKRLKYFLLDFRVPFLTIVLAGFGRSIAEVGAVQMVGGNIQYKTRVMTTAIMMQTNMGRFEFAIALGIVLLLISLLINSVVFRVQKVTADD